MDQTIEKIKENIGDSYFWASVDETTDRCSSWIANIVVIQTFDEEDAVSIREEKVATSSSTVVSDLSYVKSYFGNLTGTIVSLEARDLPLIESVKIIHTIQEGVKQTPGPVASSVATKLEQVLQRSIGWRTMGAVSNILGGQSTPLQEISLNSSELSNLKFGSLISCEVERSRYAWRNIPRKQHVCPPGRKTSLTPMFSFQTVDYDRVLWVETRHIVLWTVS
uniref:Uncharacterized protein n=1 Tax=Timema douglasi TaxID=61478 RepID=A0A7R8VT73_TIMDO|nr:unnamed protein product [Timema douglasi]